VHSRTEGILRGIHIKLIIVVPRYGSAQPSVLRKPVSHRPPPGRCAGVGHARRLG